MAGGLKKFRQTLFEADSAQSVIDRVAQFLSQELFADRVIITDYRGVTPVTVEVSAIEKKENGAQAVVRVEKGQLRFDVQSFNSLIVISNSATSRVYDRLELTLRDRGIRSFAAIPLFLADQVVGLIEIHCCQLYQRWQRSDLAMLEHVADLCSWALDRLQQEGATRPVSGADEQLRSQNSRIQALYELSRTLTIDLDPAVVALRGLRSLLRATHSASGVCVFLDSNHEQLEIVAAEGLSARYIEQLGDVVNTHSLLKRAVEQREGFRVQNLQSDSRAANDIAADEGLRATIVVPLVFEENVYGAIAIFHRGDQEYSTDDSELVNAAANQICLIARQAEFYSIEKRNAQALSALYQLTHELAKHFSAKEVAEHAFPIIQEQVPCKRMWLATLNDQRTHLVGQAGFGPGMRRRIINVQIQRSQPHQFLDQAIESRRPVIVPKGQEMECSGIRMIVRRLELGTLIILPLISLGQPVGVLLLEPENQSQYAAESRLPLLSRMAGEIATVILARRFESRMASDDKMRTAGLLASGVAHNFNNLLQAIMGQSSLIEMQLPKDSPLIRSAQLIVESSHRGAGLIKQLVACTVGETQNIESVDLTRMIEDSKDFYRSILGSPIELQMTVEPSLPTVMIDYGRVQQTIASILVHAKDAIGSRTDGKVELTASARRVTEVDANGELLPGTYASIHIKDNGTGLDKDQQARIFEPFFALYQEDPKSQVGGVAHVNLSAGHALIRNYGGTILLSSEPSDGSEFTLLIPESAARDAARREPREREEVAEKAPDVAVVMLDVDESVTISVAALVESLGYRAKALRKRQKLREFLKSSGHRPPVILIDTDRSSEDIVGFIREISGQYPAVRVLVSTFDPKRWSRLLKGIERLEMLTKPLSIWALDKLLRNLILSRETTPIDKQVERAHTPEKKNRRKRDSTIPGRAIYDEH